MNINTEELCSILQGQFRHYSLSPFFAGVSIDTREPTLKNKIFFALKGPRFNGHNFLGEALQKGALALVVDSSGLPQKALNFKPAPAVIQVPDTLKALYQLAGYWREHRVKKVIGITGSAGKTTTKTFCHTLLEGAYKVQSSPKSFNNNYGVSISILSVREQTDILVQEIGMNQTGEITFLSRLAKPDVVACLQVGDSHIGVLKSRANIAKEKEQIYISCPNAIPVFNQDNVWTKAMYQSYQQSGHKQKALLFSSKAKKADVYLTLKEVQKDSLCVAGHIQGITGEVKVPVTGGHHLTNIMCSAAVALASGLKEDMIWDRLSLCRLPPGRNQWITLANGAKALFDAYNASPESVLALLDHFSGVAVKGKKILVLGDFLELGDKLPVLQKKVAQKVAQSDISSVWLIGEQADSLARFLKQAGCLASVYVSQKVDSKTALQVVSLLDPSGVVAFKGSRGSALEKALKYFSPTVSFGF